MRKLHAPKPAIIPIVKARRHIKGRFRECTRGFVMVFISKALNLPVKSCKALSLMIKFFD